MKYKDKFLEGFFEGLGGFATIGYLMILSFFD